MLVDRLKQSAALFSNPEERQRHFAEFYHPDAIFHGYVRDRSLDFGAARTFYFSLWEAFPDFHVQILHAIEHDRMLAFRYAWEGTHVRTFAGFPPSNQPVRVEGMSFIRFDGEQAIERWNISEPLFPHTGLTHRELLS